MSDEVMVKVENVSKKFCRDLKKSLWYGVQDITGELLSRNGDRSGLRPEEFWALKDVSFELRRGESLGLIGRNGAGKSTLMKLLNGLIKPDEGRITVRGRMGALIALGAGFNPVLTGRENVYVNAAVLGIPKSRVDELMCEIIDFAELGEFMDTPVQSYSSGMKVRLGFAIAAQLKPNILLIDEVLSVGDFAFRVKCLAQLTRFAKEGVSFILVSHNETQILQHTDRVIWLHTGSIRQDGSPVDVVHKYITYDRTGTNAVSPYGPEIVGGPSHVNDMVIGRLHVALRNAADLDINTVSNDEPVSICFDFHLLRNVRKLNITCLFIRVDGLEMCRIWSLADGHNFPRAIGRITGRIDLKSLPFAPGRYSLTFAVQDGIEYLFRKPALSFSVSANKPLRWGTVDLTYEWTDANV